MLLTRGASTAPLALPSWRRENNRLGRLRVVIPGIRSTRASRGFPGKARVDRGGIAVASAVSGDTNPHELCTNEEDPIAAARRFRSGEASRRQSRRTSTEESVVTTREATTRPADAAKRAGNRRDEFKEVSDDKIAEVEKAFLNMTVKNGETFSDKSPLET